MNKSADVDGTPVISGLASINETLVVYLYISSIGIPICVFGIFSNSINITVFYKMGFSSASNICLFCLAVTDWFCLAMHLNVNVGFLPFTPHIHLPMTLEDVVFIMSSVYYGFSAMCSWITVLINMERSCCVAFPMKVRCTLYIMRASFSHNDQKIMHINFQKCIYICKVKR